MKTWKARVRDTYDSLDELKAYDRAYGVVRRCGERSAKALWNKNPLIGGSTDPRDFGKVKEAITT